MYAAAVEVLIRKSKFEPQVALGIAEAMDMAIQHSQLVTVPILDARLSALESRLETKIKETHVNIQSVRAELVRWVLLVMLGNVALTSGVMAILNAFQS